MGVRPSLDGVLRLQPASIRMRVVTGHPWWHDSSSGVNPLNVTVFTFAPPNASSRMHSWFPAPAAIAIAVTPPLVGLSSTAFAAASRRMHSGCPSWAAMKVGVTASSPFGGPSSGAVSDSTDDSEVPASTTAAVLTVTPEVRRERNWSERPTEPDMSTGEIWTLAMLTSPPAAMSSLRHSEFPFCAAMKMGVACPLVATLKSAFAAMRYLRQSTCPLCVARKTADAPP
mmetsp:Transcript_1106/g.2423  ORF Transcript_1106/g.2423 Transcript_1106/m.2423 type:complete len:228 (+) Transcript_1106:528-1211(+)